jgi:hypothetical protein
MITSTAIASPILTFAALSSSETSCRAAKQAR